MTAPKSAEEIAFTLIELQLAADVLAAIDRAGTRRRVVRLDLPETAERGPVAITLDCAASTHRPVARRPLPRWLAQLHRRAAERALRYAVDLLLPLTESEP